MSNNRSALFLGATGAVGKALLIDLLKSGNYKTITTIGRREFEYNGPNKEALIQKVVSFEKLDDHKEAFTGSYDTVFCTLGTTRADAGSVENFVKIDKDYVINAAKLIRQQNPSEDLHFLYCSSAGANPKSSFLYMKTKGEIEQELTEIGFNKVTIFRPGVLKADRVRYNFRYIELLFVLFVNLIDYVIPRKAIVHVDVVGRAMRKVATEEVEFEDYEITLADNGTLIETANHKKIHEIAS
ncbi:NAD(P)-binding protein [Rhizophagus irregularis]|uniref:NAD(P)-binding domain-containing protein n=3 Tax=Rhizophagus irregularis TaxID=588596 RepID=U9TYG8_RHIID|nr:hypothetical protein GLOIN_2v1747998 [Rhizophagus irregularis DAOM 181602=DAOM 197198]EXX69418.1 Fmp52p [Rhizophagus irregularis DAOM 197198w]PKC07492.1 NAD(P)-binding protein [Rhizophagus irregularis]PKK69481.1 NAD(P)-binding protein [Rhizophagus irregularis]PKY16251.1 NAD(P)-binding protein [Rhizophagus irregularis]PKY55325.1 NAD(P)-binding protein [Rhizophagus irregularis]|eukprot:XP_025183353.1 hypothetical protein GLOIN_2v1747998 [Rhizophagus irregularis DAOM 181602=DAOM 197198]